MGDETEGGTDGWTDGQKDGWMEGWTDGQTEGPTTQQRTGGWREFLHILENFVPYRSRCPKRRNYLDLTFSLHALLI